MCFILNTYIHQLFKLLELIYLENPKKLNFIQNHFFKNQLLLLIYLSYLYGCFQVILSNIFN